MTYEDFINHLKDNEIFLKGYGLRSTRKKGEDEIFVSGKEYIDIEWQTGGSHGNCHGDEMRPAYVEDEPDFFEFDQILELICPKITYLKFKKLEKLIDIDDRSEGEYYGGHTNHRTKTMEMKPLYEKLVEMGLLNGS